MGQGAYRGGEDRSEPEGMNYALIGSEEDERIPGISLEELSALEQERSVMDETEVQQAQRLLKDALIGSVRSMAKLALYSPQERIRLQAAQYIIERNMGRVQDTPPPPTDDPLVDLMASVVQDIDPDALKKFDNQIAALNSGVIEAENETNTEGDTE